MEEKNVQILVLRLKSLTNSIFQVINIEREIVEHLLFTNI